MNIYLVGFMGSGKTHTGQGLAAELNKPFIDLDTYISEKEKRTISAIFKENGAAYFRTIEHKYLNEISEKKQVIVALGGGTPCFYNNMNLINTTGISIYLKTDEKTLFERLKNEKESRPLIAGLNDKDLLSFISESLESRSAFYLKSTITVDAEQLQLDHLIKLINDKLLTK